MTASYSGIARSTEWSVLHKSYNHKFVGENNVGFCPNWSGGKYLLVIQFAQVLPVKSKDDYIWYVSRE